MSLSSSSSSPCPFCRPVSVICYWGPRPTRRWKRPLLVVCSLGVLLLVAVSSWALAINASSLSVPWISAYVGLDFLLLAMAALGLGAAAFGCDACVSRLCGDPF
jgi:hypothetical protein